MGLVSEHMADHCVRDSLPHGSCLYGAVVLSLSGRPGVSPAEEPQEAGMDAPIGDVGEFAIGPGATAFDAGVSGIPPLMKERSGAGCVCPQQGQQPSR